MFYLLSAVKLSLKPFIFHLEVFKTDQWYWAIIADFVEWNLKSENNKRSLNSQFITNSRTHKKVVILYELSTQTWL